MTMPARSCAILAIAWCAVGPALAGGPPPPETFAAVYAPCAHCHQIGAGSQITTGPPLDGILGRAAASYPGYPYSRAMRASGLMWDRATLDRFIASPASVVPGTRMIFPGLADPAKRSAILDFLAAPKPD